MKWGGLPGRVRVAMLGGGGYMQGAPGRVRVPGNVRVAKQGDSYHAGGGMPVGVGLSGRGRCAR